MRSPPLLGWPLWNISVTNKPGYVPLVVNTSRSFPHSWLITGFVTRWTRRVPLVGQELLAYPEHLSSSPVFSGVRVTRSLVLCVCFVERPFVLFYVGHCVVFPSLIYVFWLLLWYLQALLSWFLVYFRPMYCISFDLRHCITPFASLIWSRAIVWRSLISFFKAQIISCAIILLSSCNIVQKSNIS